MNIELKFKGRTQPKARLAAAKLYCVTAPSSTGRSYEDAVERALKGGADVIQLRDKTLSARELLELGNKLRGVCRRYDALFILNDRVDLALAMGADGVHLGQDDLPLAEARKMSDLWVATTKFDRLPEFIIGVSTHSLDQALKAESEGADYVGCGPVFKTPTKPDCEPQGLELVRKYRENLKIPFVAIGGIDESNVDQVVEAGARCVAVVRAAFGQDDAEPACRSLKSRLK